MGQAIFKWALRKEKPESQKPKIDVQDRLNVTLSAGSTLRTNGSEENDTERENENKSNNFYFLDSLELSLYIRGQSL